jgi:hypothetical protein
MFFTTSWLSKTVHAFIAHDEHETHLVCEEAAKEGKQHIHDERYAPKPECSLCAFWFSGAELPVFTEVSRRPAESFTSVALPYYTMPFITLVCDMAMRRGPPTESV